MAENVLVAGHETTSNSIAAGLHRLAVDQDLQRRLRDEPTAIPKFVEELLRTEAPVQMMPRYVTQDSELGGVAIPKGATVMVAFASAIAMMPSCRRRIIQSRSAECRATSDIWHRNPYLRGLIACQLVLTNTFRLFLERYSASNSHARRSSCTTT